MEVGEKIKNARRAEGLTQKQLGELCGMAESAIGRYEIGNANPKLETISKIAKALEVHPITLLPDWFLYGGCE